MTARHTRKPSTPLPSPSFPSCTLSLPARPKVRKAKPTVTIDTAITRLRFHLSPLHPLPAGPAHPAFPKTLLSYHLLTEAELDSLARHYHQAPPTPRSRLQESWPSIWTDGYPARMRWDEAWLGHVRESKGEEEVLKMKKRKFGRFIGLRGCETPVEEVDALARWKRIEEEARTKTGTWDYWGRGRT